MYGIATPTAFTWVSATTTDPTSSLLNYGALGALVVLLVAFAVRAYLRECARSDRLEVEVARLNKINQEQEGRYQQSLATAVEAVRESTRLITEQRDRRTR